MNGLSTKFIFVRHGQSLDQIDPSIRFSLGYENAKVKLSPIGEDQARYFGDHTLIKILNDIGGEYKDIKWWSSPSKRASQSIRLAKKACENTLKISLPSPVFFDGKLREQVWPKFNNIQEQERYKLKREARGAGAFKYKSRSLESSIAGMKIESRYDVVKRLQTFLNHHKDKKAFGKINVIFSHEVTMRAALFILNETEQRPFDIEFDNCEYIIQFI